MGETAIQVEMEGMPFIVTVHRIAGGVCASAELVGGHMGVEVRLPAYASTEDVLQASAAEVLHYRNTLNIANAQ